MASSRICWRAQRHLLPGVHSSNTSANWMRDVRSGSIEDRLAEPACSELMSASPESGLESPRSATNDLAWNAS
jgi:hypothetical protein